LEEVSNADLILHVVDISSDYYDTQMKVVLDVLDELGAGGAPRINVYNKADRLSGSSFEREDGVRISALNKTGLPELLLKVGETLNMGQRRVELTVPYDKYEAVTLIRAIGSLIKEEHAEDGIKVTAMLDEAGQMRVKHILEK
jgi:GTP-binding protein HflX